MIDNIHEALALEKYLADGYKSIVRESADMARYANGYANSQPIVVGSKVYRLAIDMWRTAHAFNKGHRLAQRSPDHQGQTTMRPSLPIDELSKRPVSKPTERRTCKNPPWSMTVLACCALLAASTLAAQAADPPALRDPQIARAADGSYYLIGTTKINTLEPKHADFQNNDGVRLWKSKDLKTWDEVGLVWDLSKTGGRDGRKSGWQAHLRSVPDQPDKEWSRGVTAPELHFIKGGWWIVFTLNDHDIGLLKSKTEKPEGPYEEVGRLSNRFLGGDGSLFQDSDGKVYFVWGAGYLAPMKEDMSDTAKEPVSLRLAIEGYPQAEALRHQRGERGAFLSKAGDGYRFVYAAWNLRDGKGHFDTLACESKSLYGPYSAPRVLIPDGGQATFFRDKDGTGKAVFSQNDQVRIIEKEKHK